MTENHFNGWNPGRLSYCLPAMLLDRPRQSDWGARKQNTDRLTRHKHAAFHLLRSVACLSSPLCELSAEHMHTRRWRLRNFCLEEAAHTTRALWNGARVGLICKAILTTKVKTLDDFKPKNSWRRLASFLREAVEEGLRPLTLCLSMWHGLCAVQASRQCNVTVALAMKAAPNLHERESWRCTQLACDRGANKPAVNTIITTSRVAVFKTKLTPNTAAHIKVD